MASLTKSININKIYCSICFEEYDNFNEMFFSDDCVHIFCLECMKTLCRVFINEGNTEIKCPDKNCKSWLSYNDVKLIIEYDSNLNEKYENFLLNNKLESMDDIVWCPIPFCGKPVPTKFEISTKCIHCNYRFCYKCGAEPHRDMTCEENKRLEEKINSGKDSFDAWLEFKGDKVKICPHCKYRCERISGCDVVKCGKCNKKFCFRCSCSIEGYLEDNHFDVPSGCINTYEKSGNHNNDNDDYYENSDDSDYYHSDTHFVDDDSSEDY